MSPDRHEQRHAYEAAKAHYRAFYERYYPKHVLGGRAAEAVTPEVLLEMERLAAVSEAARVAWVASRDA